MLVSAHLLGSSAGTVEVWVAVSDGKAHDANRSTVCVPDAAQNGT